MPSTSRPRLDQGDDFIASISTYESLYCNSTAGYSIMLKECIRLNTIKGNNNPDHL